VTLRQTRDRFTAGEVTRTDVAQAESRLSGGRSQLSLAESNYVTAQAQYLQVIGVPPPARLAPAPPVDRLSPRTLEGAIARGRTEHPLITTAMYNVDIALQQVKIAEAALAPTLAAVGNVQKNFGNVQSLAVLETLQASIAAQLTVPIYQGGAEYAAIRQAKETLGQRRLDLDTARDQVQATVTQAWGQLDAAKAQIDATQSQVTAAEVALNGVREEARVGQRTTLDVLNSQQISSMRGWRSSPRNATGLWRPIRCWRRPARFPRKSSGSRSRSMTRPLTTSRCATPGAACARPTDVDAEPVSMIYGPNEKVAILECPRLLRSLVSCCTLGAHGYQSVITAQRRPGLPVEVWCWVWLFRA
jgi:hypothetical protein